MSEHQDDSKNQEPKELSSQLGENIHCLHLIDGEKGGVGKSMMCRVLVHYYLTHQIDFKLFEADQSNRDIERIYSKATTCADVKFTEAEERVNEVDKIFEAALEKSVIVNLPGGMFELVNDWISRNDLLTLCPQNQIQLVKWFVSNGKSDSLQFFRESVEKYKDNLSEIVHVLVCNEGLHKNWQELLNSAEMKSILETYKIPTITLPKLSLQELALIDKNNLTFAEAADKQNQKMFGMLGSQRIVTFLKMTSKAIENTELAA
ncbi:hypothetical protein [Allocoleopsis franciscana]|uniref:Mobilization protein MobD-like protein n=1 Tax=Allocoleopsis franciscana PCC 7113 TaxID=1173027 RepID=K9WNW7_9CYAN|nr:hypothetical protein [Allocoleopsis franciscana]AFZ22065.1 hypothetical protein Mic7113_6485 [Allocoleopsis franciscana PCC 7113]